MAEYQLTVNNKNYSVSVDADTPLLWVLRDTLGLTGTKYSCGEGICGTCTVLIDGKADRSCSINIKDAVGKKITTIEGFAENPTHPVFKTWIDLEVSQCGYCQPGQILTLASLFEENPRPSLKQVEEIMDSVLCRCGTNHRIKKAIVKLFEEGE
jgi:isoquinoline 1-oxidoreductase subunit alpha